MNVFDDEMGPIADQETAGRCAVLAGALLDPDGASMLALARAFERFAVGAVN